MTQGGPCFLRPVLTLEAFPDVTSAPAPPSLRPARETAQPTKRVSGGRAALSFAATTGVEATENLAAGLRPPYPHKGRQGPSLEENTSEPNAGPGGWSAFLFEGKRLLLCVWGSFPGTYTSRCPLPFVDVHKHEAEAEHSGAARGACGPLSGDCHHRARSSGRINLNIPQLERDHDSLAAHASSQPRLEQSVDYFR